MIIYYDSKTGNVQRFIDKLRDKRPDWKYIKITKDILIQNEGHLITYTTNFGVMPEVTEEFMKIKSNRDKILSASSSGNMNWGPLFGIAIDKLNEEYGTPKIMKFELSGKNNEVEYFINEVENWK